MADLASSAESCYIIDKHLKALQDATIAAMALDGIVEDVGEDLIQALNSISSAMTHNCIALGLIRVNEEINARKS